MKNVYLVQANPVYGESMKNTYLPYAAGSVAAFAWADKAVAANYRLGRIVFLRENIDDAVASLDNPFLVGFSSYIWNTEYNKEFARRLKKRFPGCVTVFGGHNVQPDASDLAEDACADIAVHGEGEVPFREILLALLKGGIKGDCLGEISNISYRGSDGTIRSTPKSPPADIAGFPSPLLTGVFNDIIKLPEFQFSYPWETNRGCPNNCAYCDWGGLKYGIREFPMERLRAELDWLAAHNIEFLYCTDANFGILDRDEQIVDLIIDSKKRTGYPDKLKANYTKNRNRFVLNLGIKLMEHNIGKSATLAFQTLNPAALKNIGRAGMNLEHFKRLMTLYNEAGVPVYSDLILGLPGETYGSFADGICTLFDCGQHKAMGIYPCELLPNSHMAQPEYRQKHGIEAKKIPFSQYHCVENENDVREFSYIVTQTNTMLVDDWKKSYLFSVFVQALHNLGLTRAIAMFLRYELAVPYRAFYEKLIARFSALPDDSLCGSEYALMARLTEGIARGENSFTRVFEGLGNITWGYEEHIFLRFAAGIDEFYREVEAFLDEFLADSGLRAGLVRYQKGIVRKLGESSITVHSAYDFYGYFQKLYLDKYEPLRKTPVTLRFEDSDPSLTWEDYGRKNIWFGRYDDNTLYTGGKKSPVVEYGEYAGNAEA